jgi:MYXO-CTERM domain-containing protein
MKTITRTMSILALSGFLAVSTPTMAQGSSETTNSGATSSNDRDDNSGKWGLLGLAGLLGLLGLKRKDDDRHRNTSVNR